MAGLDIIYLWDTGHVVHFHAAAAHLIEIVIFSVSVSLIRLLP